MSGVFPLEHFGDHSKLPGMRNGIVMNLLWRGVGAYMKNIDARYVFGCASIKTVEPAITCAIYNHLNHWAIF